MSVPPVSLAAMAQNFGHGIISLTGGGGKTSLLFLLADALAAAGESVLCTTTTRMRRPEPTEAMRIAVTDAIDDLQPPDRILFAARPPVADRDRGKVVGFPPEAIDALHDRGIADWILVEADGAAQLPLKAPAAHEPVVPSRTATAIAVIGLDSLYKPLNRENAFRVERITALTGLRPGGIITPETLAALAAHPHGLFKNIPKGSRRVLFCNKSDLPGAEAAGEAVAARVQEALPDVLDAIVIGSLHGKGLLCTPFPKMR